MYAIIDVGGKQYQVREGDLLNVELIYSEGKQQTEGEVKFDKVLLLHDGVVPQVGLPYVEKCLVQAEIIKEQKGPKVIAFKYKRRNNYRRKVGHRQKYSQVRIKKIVSA